MGLRIEDHLDDGNNGKPNGSPSNGGGQPRRRASLTQSVLDRLELEAQQQRKLDYRRAKAKWVILPDARFLTVWLAIIGPLIVYNVIWVPIEVSQMAAPTTTHGQIDFILDFFFYVDMILTFRTAYIDKDNELVLDGKQIANRYIFRGNFVVDLIATLQWEVFFTCLSGNGCQTAFTNTEDAGGAGAVFSVFRLPRLLRLIRLFKKIDRYPSLKVFKLLFVLGMVAHWVGCLWFLVGWASMAMNGAYDGDMYLAQGVSSHGTLSTEPAFSNYPRSSSGSFGDSWLMRHFGPKNIYGHWGGSDVTLPVADSVAFLASPNGSVVDVVEVSQLYVTSIYWSFTMLMKSPHIGPDTWIEKLFSCSMVVLGLFVTTQIVAVVTQVVMSFDKAHSAFRDRQQEYSRFSHSRSLPTGLRRKLLSYSLQDWSVNGGFDPLEVIKQLGLPPALTNQMLSSMYDDVVQESPLLKVIDAPVLHELLKYVKVVVSLQKETLIHQSDPCTRVYILRGGSLQLSATDKLMQQAQNEGKMASPDTKQSKAKKTGKAKMQVRMIERTGSVICCASPFEPPQPLPFQVTSLKRTTLLSLHMQDLLTILDMVSEKQQTAICKSMHAEHRDLLLSVMPKTKGGGADQSSRDSRVDNDPMPSALDDSPKEQFDEKDLSERRLQALEVDIDRVISAMAELHKEARQIPRLVQALAHLHKKPLGPMGPHATAALSATPAPASSPADSEVNKLVEEVNAAS